MLADSAALAHSSAPAFLAPPYPLSAFIARIGDLQQEVKELKAEIEEVRRRESGGCSPCRPHRPRFASGATCD